jgi:hypothetical protein
MTDASSINIATRDDSEGMTVPLLKKKPTVEPRPAKHGKGLFATKRFRPGQVVGVVNGEFINDPDYGSDYCIDLGDGCSLEPGEPYRYLNHSCESNCKLFLDYEDDEPVENRKVVLEALRNIQPNTELTIDYEWPAESAIPCGCESPNCRGWVCDPTELHLIKTTARRLA